MVTFLVCDVCDEHVEEARENQLTGICYNFGSGQIAYEHVCPTCVAAIQTSVRVALHKLHQKGQWRREFPKLVTTEVEG